MASSSSGGPLHTRGFSLPTFHPRNGPSLVRRQNMGERSLDRIEAKIEGLKAQCSELPEEVAKLLEQWTQLVIDEARTGLNRPTWLLARSLGQKVKDYNGRKIFALVGFRYLQTHNKRDPGYYGRFHEGGWAPPGQRLTAPDHFIRKARKKYLPVLQDAIDILAKELTQ